MNLYGQIDLTALWAATKAHPELIREWTDSKGQTHKTINIDVSERATSSSNGATHYIKIAAKKEQQKDGIKYYISDLKPSQFNQAQTTQKKSSQQQNDNDDAPF